MKKQLKAQLLLSDATILVPYLTMSHLPSSDKVAGQSDVDQAGDNHSDSEHPSGGQEREGEEVPHHLRGHETRGEPQTGGHAERSSSAKLTERHCETWGTAESTRSYKLGDIGSTARSNKN